REFFTKYDDVHENLRGGGKWTGPDQGPNSVEEWRKVEAYMGLFEHCNIMIDDGLIDVKTFKDIYDYRVKNILQNKIIKTAKLEREKKSWENFIQLCNKLGYPV
ncbi:MAG TPA: hypothetical protein VJ695_08110, partial [Nitrososphaera sp.]|nr:hypothetical protein [Nitrososphaera sp.]